MTKPVLLLLPGLMCDAAVWQGQIEAFEPGYDVRVPDFSALDSMEAMADAVLALAEGPFAMAGHSMGGRVAMQVLGRAPERVLRAALLDTGAHIAPPDEALRRQVLLDIAASDGIEAVIQAWLPPMIAHARRDDTVLWNAIADMLRRAGIDTLKRQVRALLNRPDGFAPLAQARCPVAFIVGRQDGWSPPEQHAQMQARTPGSTLAIIEDSGHRAPREAPAAVNRALQDWLNA